MTTTVNESLIRLVIAQIEDTPQHWSQHGWVRHNCNTKFCFAGWASVMTDMVDGSGKPTKKGIRYARKLMRSLVEKKYWSEDAIKNVGLETDNSSYNRQYWKESGFNQRPEPEYNFPWEQAGQDLLGLTDFQAATLFSAYAADPSNRWFGEESREDIEVLKAKITELTGVEFDDSYQFEKVAA